MKRRKRIGGTFSPLVKSLYPSGKSIFCHHESRTGLYEKIENPATNCYRLLIRIPRTDHRPTLPPVRHTVGWARWRLHRVWSGKLRSRRREYGDQRREVVSGCQGELGNMEENAEFGTLYKMGDINVYAVPLGKHAVKGYILQGFWSGVMCLVCTCMCVCTCVCLLWPWIGMLQMDPEKLHSENLKKNVLEYHKDTTPTTFDIPSGLFPVRWKYILYSCDNL